MMEFCPSSGRIFNASTTSDTSVTKAFKVFNFIVSRGGDIVLTELVKHPSPLKDLSEAQAVEWLKEFSEPVQGDQPLEKPCFILLRNSNREWAAKVCLRVKLCSRYETEGKCAHGNNCFQWHVCRGYLDGTCKNKLCSLSHNLLDKQNIQKAQRYALEKHPSNSICKVLAKNLPFICEGYVKGECSTTEMCHNLHLCHQYARGTCKNTKKDCLFSHDVNSGENRAIFKQFGVPIKYSLAHVLFPKSVKVLKESPVERSVFDVEKGTGPKIPNHPGKVNNWNNLNTVSGSMDLVDRKTLLNIEGSTVTNQKRHNITEQFHEIEGSELKQKTSKQQSKKIGISALPLMLQDQCGIGLPGRYPKSNITSYPVKACSIPNNANVDQPSARKKKEFNLKSDPQHKQTFGSRENLPCTKDEQIHLKSGAKPKQKQNNVVEMQTSLKEACPMEMSLQPPDQPKKKRNRRKQKQKFPDSHDETTEVNQEIVESPIPDLIEFDGDDLDEGKLVDLDYDYSDPGLSQMSEVQAQAMWDLFSKDLLIDDASQPDEEFSSLDSVSSLTKETPSEGVIFNASVKGVFNFIVKQSGTVKFNEISSNHDLWDPCFTEHKEWFSKHKSWFLLVEDNTGNIDEVKAVSFKAKICLKYNGKGSTCTQEKCHYFHICDEYITNGRCSNFNGSCKKSHGFKDSHNKAIASKLFPNNDFSAKQLRQLIISSTPQVCLDYNNLRCKKGNKCLKVHICKNTGYKKCPKGKCKLAHENGLRSPKTKSLLAKYGIHISPKINLQMLARTLLVVNDGRTDFAKNTSESLQNKQEKFVTIVNSDVLQYCIKSHAINNHICPAFLVGKCNKGTKCHDHHCWLPYQWVYNSGHKWIVFGQKENEEVEKLFCEDSLNDECIFITLKLDLSAKPELSALHDNPYIYNLDLKAMTIESLDNDCVHIPMKRLSTDSDVLLPGNPLATTWYWYWKTEHNFYVEYHPSKGCKEPTSTSIERFYQEGMSRYDFRFDQHDYRLYFNGMYQKNMDTKFLTKRDVLRRPKFVSPAKFNQLKRNSSALTNVESNNEIPNHWKKMSKDQHYLLKRLEKSSKEYKKTMSLFVNSMGDYDATVHSIDRIQNPFMWEKYRRKKERMERHLENKQVDERQLFHGTSYKNIRSICKDNFDWRLYGEVTGNIYGEGAYFARDASFSHNYCSDDEDGIRHVFVARVLVGSFTKGEKTYRRPPRKNPDDPYSELFDSCVDNASNPQIFVGFDVDQYYPEYVIEYGYKPIDNSPLQKGHGINISPLSNSASYSSPMSQPFSLPIPQSSSSASYSPNTRVSYQTCGPGSMPHNQQSLICQEISNVASASVSSAEQKMLDELGKFEKSAKYGDSCAVM